MCAFIRSATMPILDRTHHVDDTRMPLISAASALQVSSQCDHQGQATADLRITCTSADLQRDRKLKGISRKLKGITES
jgi:hypothetical protein